MSLEILGYDCDGKELHEFDIIRAIWYSDINFEKENNIDPREYCIVKALDGNPYLISVHDFRNRKAINRFEGRELDSRVPIKIRPITDAENYERAVDCYGNPLSVEYNVTRTGLIKTLNRNLSK